MYRTHAAAGLCAACKHDPDCIYEVQSEGAVLHCEQFELASGDARAGYREREPHAPAVDPSARARSEGLCASCHHRPICIYPKPEGGVWRCEEYL